MILWPNGAAQSSCHLILNISLQHFMALGIYELTIVILCLLIIHPLFAVLLLKSLLNQSINQYLVLAICISLIPYCLFFILDEAR